jgi:hypothetical protein
LTRALDPLHALTPNPLRVTLFTNRSLTGEPIGPPVTAPVIMPLSPALGIVSTTDSLTVEIVP